MKNIAEFSSRDDHAGRVGTVWCDVPCFWPTCLPAGCRFVCSIVDLSSGHSFCVSDVWFEFVWGRDAWDVRFLLTETMLCRSLHSVWPAMEVTGVGAGEGRSLKDDPLDERI